MASAPPTSPLRQVLEGQLSQLSNEVERLFDDARGRARRELADQLNQAVRRIRQAGTSDEIGATLLDAAGVFASGCALFEIHGQLARGARIRGVSEDAAQAFPSMEIPLASAAALAGAVETKDPVVAVTTPAEVSQQLAILLAHPDDGRASLFPLVANHRVPAVLYAWGAVQGSVLELLAQVAAAVWPEPSALVAPPAPDLVTIAPAASAPQPDGPQTAMVRPTRPDAASTWDALSPGEQEIHLRAQRFARVQVAEMRLNEAAAVQSGRAQRNLYEALRSRIDAARVTLRQSFFAQCPSMVDYLHVELVRALTHDDPDMLGKDYPGPLV